MRLYDCVAGCLVDDVVLHRVVIAKNEKDAWLKGYYHYNYECSVADGGSVDCFRIKDFSKYAYKNGRLYYTYE